jgi:oligopeptide/dipeptide ABC transporter ATP-binding protein
VTSLLTLDDVSVRLPIDGELRPILDGVAFSIGERETVGLVGESGSGKSMTARAIARLLPVGGVASGRVMFDGVDVFEFNDEQLRSFRSTDLGMVFQDPRAHVNPVRRIGDFMTEALRERDQSRGEAVRRALQMLDEVGLGQDERILRQFPHELSGGMLQRVMIAAALATEPRVLLADEPTTALDVTTQAEIIAILERLQRDHRLAVLFITHDLELAAATCDRICVMYAGRIVEVQDAEALFRSPLHPYTAGLLASRPEIDHDRPIQAIPGRPISLFEAPQGCAFAPRCPYAVEESRAAPPPLRPVAHGLSACVRAEEILPELVSGQGSTHA